MYEVKVVDSRIRLKLSGSIDAEKAAKIEESLVCLVESGLALFVVDFSEVDSIDPAGLKSILSIQTRVWLRGGCVVMKGMNGIGGQRGEFTGVKAVSAYD